MNKEMTSAENSSVINCMLISTERNKGKDETITGEYGSINQDIETLEIKINGYKCSIDKNGMIERSLQNGTKNKASCSANKVIKYKEMMDAKKEEQKENTTGR